MVTDQENRLGPTIALVGPNAAGKSTLARRLAEDLRQAGRTVVLTREPGGSPGAEEIRRLVVEGDRARWSPWTETLLFMAARRDHLERVIWPSLARGNTVITDRYLDDTRVFQWVKDNALADPIEDLVKSFSIPEAQLTILVDVTPKVAAERIKKAEDRGTDRFEGDPNYDSAVRGRFLFLAELYRERIVTIDGDGEPEVVYAALRQALLHKGIC